MSPESYHSNQRKAVFDHVLFLAASLSHLGLTLHLLYFLFFHAPRNTSELTLSLEHSWDMNKAWMLHSSWMTPWVTSINSYTWSYYEVLVSRAVCSEHLVWELPGILCFFMIPHFPWCWMSSFWRPKNADTGKGLYISTFKSTSVDKLISSS